MNVKGRPTCHGCSRNWYSASGGQQTYPGAPAILALPHSRCLELSAYIPMVLGEHGKWVGSEVPPECPVWAKPAPIDTKAAAHGGA